MNKIFETTQKERIQLCNEYWLYPDSFKGLVLQREVEKSRKKIDKDNKKPTGETEQYTDIQQWYFPKLSQTLTKYLSLKTSEAKSVEELKTIVLRVEDLITTIVKDLRN